MRSLLWKEWHEQRWKLAFTTLLLAGFAFCGLHARVVADEEVLLYLCVIAAILMPVLIGTVLVAPEREERTLDTLLALPEKPVVILAVKTLIGVVLCVTPLVVTCILSLMMASGREMSAVSIIGLFLRCTLTTLALFFWMLAFTIRLPSETRATLLGLGVLIGWMIITLGLVEAGRAEWLRVPWSVNPTVFMVGRQDKLRQDVFATGALMLPLLVQIGIAALLWRWASHQFAAEEARS